MNIFKFIKIGSVVVSLATSADALPPIRAAWELNGDLNTEMGSAGPVQAVGWTPSYIAYDGGGGNDAVVFPEFSSSQWLFADTADTTANPSGASFVNNYTIMMDVKFDNTSQWIGLYQTNNNNLNNAELYIESDGSGIGVNGDYGSSPQFSFLDDSWYRITIVADLDIDQALEVYVDGNLENTIPVLSQDGRWSFNDQSNTRGLLFFTDDDGASETASGALNSLAIWDTALDTSEVAAFGGPAAEGISAVLAEASCLPQITLFSVEPGTGTATLSFKGIPNTSYTCKSSPDLSSFPDVVTPTSGSFITGPDTGDGTGVGTAEVDISPIEDKRFYRLEAP